MTDRTGLVIASASKFSYYPVEVEGVAASASAIFTASEYQGKSLRIGRLEIFTSEFSRGKIFTTSCGPKGVIILISDPVINIGMIRLILTRSSKEIKELFEESFDLDEDDPISFFRF